MFYKIWHFGIFIFFYYTILKNFFTDLSRVLCCNQLFFYINPIINNFLSSFILGFDFIFTYRLIGLKIIM